MKSIRFWMVFFMLVLCFAAGCAPVPAAAPTLTNTTTPLPTATTVPTETATPVPPTDTPQPTATATLLPTATITPDAAIFSQYFKQLVLTGADGMTETTQFQSEAPFCLRHVTTAKVTAVQEAIYDPAAGTYIRSRADIFDNGEFGVLARGDRSSCGPMPALAPGTYEYELWVGEALVARLPFEIIP